MKKRVTILWITLIFSHAFGQKLEIKQSLDKHVEIVSENELYGVTYDKKIKIPIVYTSIEVLNGMLLLSMDTAAGLANLNGEIVIPVRFDAILKSENGEFIAYKENMHFYYSAKGVALKNRFDFEKKVTKHLSVVMLNDLFGLTYNGEIKIPINYAEYNVSGDLIYLYAQNKNGEMLDVSVGIANEKGEMIIPAEFDEIEEFKDVIFVYKNEKIGLFNRQGKLLAPVVFKNLEYFRHSILGATEDKFVLYNTDGSVILPLSEKEIRVIDELGLEYAVKEKNQFKVIIPKDKEILIDYVPVSDQLFSKNTEVSILDYLAFVAHQKENNVLWNNNANAAITFVELLPDTSQIEKKLLPAFRNFINETSKEDGDFIIDYYVTKNKKSNFKISIPFDEFKTSKRMLDFPITGITRNQAALYAKWLTIMYGEILENNDYGYTVNFRLPTEEEWVAMAESGLSDSMRKRQVLDSVNAENCMLFIYNDLPKCKGYSDYLKASLGGGSVPVLSMNPDWNGMYQLFGNVSEFTSRSGVSKGGSHAQSAKMAKTNQIQSTEGPKPWLGFRVVAELIFME